MLRKKTLWLSLLILLLLFGIAITLCLLYHPQDDSSIPMDGMVDELSDDTHTHGAVIFIESDIDVLMLGTWQHTADTNWYRVYTTEPAGDDFCWVGSGTKEKIYSKKTCSLMAMDGLNGKRLIKRFCNGT